MEPDDKPWTSRSSVALVGLRRQASEPNYLHELLDCRWERCCQALGEASSGMPGRDIITDYGRSLGFQKLDGSVTLMSKSRLYIHNLDRAAIASEHLALQGWNIHDVAWNDFTNDWPPETRQHLFPDEGDKKRRKLQRRQPDVALRDLAGQSMELGVVGPLVLCGLLAGDNDIFTHGPLLDFLFDLSGADSRVFLSCIDGSKLEDYVNLVNDDPEEDVDDMDHVEG